MFNLCQYKELFGKPGEGIHKYRIFDIAIVDTVIVVICALFVAWILKTPFLYTLVCIFILGIIVHRAFCVRTGLDKMLFSK